MSENIRADRVAFLEELEFLTINIETDEKILEVLRGLKEKNDATIHAYKLFIEKSIEDPLREHFKADYDKAVRNNERIAVLLQQSL